MKENIFQMVKNTNYKNKEAFIENKLFVKGQLIYRKANPVNNIFRVKMGSVKLVSTGSKQQCIIQHIVSEGQYFGVLDLFTSTGSRRLTAYANKKRTILEVMPLEAFKAKFKNQSEFTKEIWLSIGQLRKESDWKFEVYLSETIEERMIKCLIRLAQTQGRKTPSGIKFQMLTHWEYAEYLGMARQSITMVLNQLKRENKIEYDRNTIIVKKELIAEYQHKLISNLTL